MEPEAGGALPPVCAVSRPMGNRRPRHGVRGAGRLRGAGHRRAADGRIARNIGGSATPARAVIGPLRDLPEVAISVRRYGGTRPATARPRPPRRWGAVADATMGSERRLPPSNADPRPSVCPGVEKHALSLDLVASQPVRRLLDLGPDPDDSTRVCATVELTCGCTVTRSLPEDRIVERPGGEHFAVGKIPCPHDHPVRAPS